MVELANQISEQLTDFLGVPISCVISIAEEFGELTEAAGIVNQHILALEDVDGDVLQPQLRIGVAIDVLQFLRQHKDVLKLGVEANFNVAQCR